MKKINKEEIISTLSVIPSSLSESDIKDMFYIADQHFQGKTPNSVQVSFAGENVQQLTFLPCALSSGLSKFTFPSIFAR